MLTGGNVKTRIVFVVLLTSMLLIASSALAQKIGYINSQRIVQNYKEAQDTQ